MAVAQNLLGAGLCHVERRVAEAEPRHFTLEARRHLSVQQDRPASASAWCGRKTRPQLLAEGLQVVPGVA
jgi:hypothetical protein